jgi:hypothetical protein
LPQVLIFCPPSYPLLMLLFLKSVWMFAYFELLVVIWGWMSCMVRCLWLGLGWQDVNACGQAGSSNPDSRIIRKNLATFTVTCFVAKREWPATATGTSFYLRG